MLKKYVTTTVAALGLALGLSSHALGYAEYYGYADSTAGYEKISGSDEASVQSSVGVAGTGGTLSYGDQSFAYSSGYADAARLKLGLYGMVSSGPLNSYHSVTYLETAIENRFTVSPGTSGLVVGDSTTLQLTVRLDGALSGKSASYPGSGDAWAELAAGLTIYDLSNQICGAGEEGCWFPQMASFGASTQLEAYDIYYPYWGYTFAAPWDDFWQTSSNIGGNDSFSDSGEHQETGQNTSFVESHPFDTGLLTLAFEAVVGHTLELNADLSSLVQGNYDARAEADFDNTFLIRVNPQADGVQLNWEIAPRAVPLPGGLSLLGTGLLLLVAKKKSRTGTPRNENDDRI